jgi:peroxiredoxin
MMDPAARVLKIGETLPDLTLPSVAHGTLPLKEHIRDAWSVVLFYRGRWCPFCNTQLAEREIPVFEELGFASWRSPPIAGRRRGTLSCATT